MKKRILSILLAAVCSISMLSGCGNSGDEAFVIADGAEQTPDTNNFL